MYITIERRELIYWENHHFERNPHLSKQINEFHLYNKNQSVVAAAAARQARPGQAGPAGAPPSTAM